MTRCGRRSQPTLAFCERVTAGPFSLEHIRRVGPEGLKLGGGAPDTTLCGGQLSKGWDLRTPVSDDSVARLSVPTEQAPHGFLCSRCVVEYWRMS